MPCCAFVLAIIGLARRAVHRLRGTEPVLTPRPVPARRAAPALEGI